MPTFNFTVSSQSIKDVVERDRPPATIHTIEQCFVDLNLELNENFNTNIPTKTANFKYSTISVSEGYVGKIYVELNSPSTLGIEELDVYFTGTNSTGATINDDILFGFDTNQPLRIAWDVGEKEKEISFTAKTDYVLDGIEQFNFKLDHFINCVPGTPSQTTVSVTNTTTLPSVAIESTNGSYVKNAEGIYKLNFGINEGDNKDIKIALSYPSISGQEAISVVFVNQNTSNADYQTSIQQPINLTWGVGEQVKIINVSAVLDSQLFESSIETVLIRLQNPSNVIIQPEPITIPSTGIGRFPFSTVQIYNEAPIFEYARLYLTPFATQPGRSNGKVLLKQPYASYNNGYNQGENNKFLKYQSSAPNTFEPQFSVMETLNNFNDDKLSVEIKNIGTKQVLINGTIINVNETITIDSLPNTYYIDLPANLIETTNIDNETIIVTAKYEITVNMKYVGNTSSAYTNGQFKLKNLNNTDASTSKKFQLGVVELNTYSQSTYLNPQKTYQISTKFSGIGTGRVGVNCPVSSFLDSTSENAQVNGLYFIDYYSTTQYIGVEFLQNGGIVPTCNSSQYVIPYKIIP
jgi:hypothetical protein